MKYSQTLIRMLPCRMALMLAFLCIAQVAQADPAKDMQPYIDPWVDQFVDTQTKNVLDTLPGPPDEFKIVLRELKKALKDQILEALIGQQISLSMAQILDIVTVGTHAAATSAPHNKPACNYAALEVASDGLNARRTVRGAAKTIVDVLSDLVKAAGGVKRLAQSELKDAFRKAVAELFTPGALEVFGERWTVGNCFVSVNVIWLKTRGEFHYLVLGDCSCREVSVPLTGNSVRLAQWSVRGRGVARWVGAEEEKRLSSGVEAKSTISGRPRLDKLISNAACCQNGTAVPLGVHPYSDPMQSAHLAPCPDPKEGGEGTQTAQSSGNTEHQRPTTQAGLARNRAEYADLDGTIPQIPDGAVPEDKKMELLTQSVAALRLIEDKKYLAELELEALEKGKYSDNPPTAEELDVAHEKIRELETLEDRARETLNRIERLVAPNSDEDTSGTDIIFTTPESSVLFADHRAAIEDDRAVAACVDQ